MTTISEVVEFATLESLTGPDWGRNMQIVDILARKPHLSEEFVKMIRKRIQNRNPNVQMLALTLLETLVKNCGEYVYVVIGSSDFQKTFVSILMKEIKKNAGRRAAVEAKILELIQSWADGFTRLQERYPLFQRTYDQLLEEGIAFPPRPAGPAVPIVTPPASHPVARPPPVGPVAGGVPMVGSPAQPRFVLQPAGFDIYGRPIYVAVPAPPLPPPPPPSAVSAAPPASATAAVVAPPVAPVAGTAAAAAVPLSFSALPPDASARREKLTKDLQQVSENVSLLNELLSGAARDGASPESVKTNETIAELAVSIRLMQDRVLALVETGVDGDETLMNNLLARNDEIVAALSRLSAMTSPHPPAGAVPSRPSSGPVPLVAPHSVVNTSSNDVILDFGMASAPSAATSSATAAPSPPPAATAATASTGDMFSQLAREGASKPIEKPDPFAQIARESSSKTTTSDIVASDPSQSVDSSHEKELLLLEEPDSSSAAAASSSSSSGAQLIDKPAPAPSEGQQKRLAKTDDLFEL